LLTFALDNTLYIVYNCAGNENAILYIVLMCGTLRKALLKHYFW